MDIEVPESWACRHCGAQTGAYVHPDAPLLPGEVQHAYCAACHAVAFNVERRAIVEKPTRGSARAAKAPVPQGEDAPRG